MGRAPCCDKSKVKKGPWSVEEDAKLKDYIQKNGTGGNWIALPQKVGLNRCGKSCRLRWLNYLRPNIKHGEFSDEEDGIICSLYSTIGSRWSIIAAQLPRRTDNDIKNYWNTKLKKKFFMGFSSQSQETSSSSYPITNMMTNHHLSTLNTTNLITPSPYLQQNPSFYEESNPKPFSILYNDPTPLTDGFFAPFQLNFEDVKSNMLIFGSEGGVTNSPDGSCITNQINNHDNNNQSFFITDHEYVGFSGFRQNNPLAYDGIQEINELISSSPIEKLGFFVDYPLENGRF